MCACEDEESHFSEKMTHFSEKMRPFLSIHLSVGTTIHTENLAVHPFSSV
jgi:hypothetical protein